ncbi:hypothetical protein V2G26_019074 [Clonostachys chloroleuca]
MQLSYVAAFAACISTGVALAVDVSTSPSIKFCKDPYFQGGCTEPSCPVGDCINLPSSFIDQVFFRSLIRSVVNVSIIRTCTARAILGRRPAIILIFLSQIPTLMVISSRLSAIL